MAQRNADGRVRASGGLVLRRGAGGVEVLLIHRPPPRLDWSLPKGKAERGESDEQAALREVEEESGWRCTLGPFIGTSEYVDRLGRAKTVRWWLMTPVSDVGFAGGEDGMEIDERRWVAVDDARALVDYDADRVVIDKGHGLFISALPEPQLGDTNRS
jgi:8-oxo-dGTP pyrophosphatase MutT (NUDIX family)